MNDIVGSNLWPFGGGACGALIRERNWAGTPLGPLAAWSPELRVTVSNIVNSPIAKVLMWGPDHVLLYNDSYRDIAGERHPAAIGSPVRTAFPELWDWNRAVLEAASRGEVVSRRDQPIVFHRASGDETLTLDLFYTPVYAGDGDVGGVMCTIVDNSRPVDARRRLASSNSRFRTAMDAVHGVLWTNSADGRMLGEQAGWAALTGQSATAYRDFGWTDAVHPEDVGPTIAAWNAAVAARSMFVFEHRVRRHCGSWRNFAIRALPILTEEGDILEWVGVHTDITDQRAAESQLRLLNETLETRVIAEIDERRMAEAKLVQAQKMETIGQLTGGVAHDFNNLLQVVSGNLQLLERDIAGNERAERRVANALAGVSRGSKLAAQLLAFGRRQALEPKVVNVTRFVRGMDDMLRRAIGEGIEVKTVIGNGLWNTFIDPAQMENALLNLAINARDAMNGDGKLTIELGNASLDDAYASRHEDVLAGQYVLLAVTDTGAGMPPEIVDKVFEPFFSTKEEGKGSGLGLSMVYGFVKQSGGHVKIYSEPGEGTTIKLYLPRAIQSEETMAPVEVSTVIGGSETVLVVEDDEDVRNTAVELLADLGYRVLRAIDAASALNVIESGIPIDVLFTDVVMPGAMKSPELAQKARERLPTIAVLFTSGYTENSIVHGGKLDQGVELLSKPYTREALARKMRLVIASQTPPASSPAAPAPARRITILLVEDDELIRLAAAEMLQESGFVVIDAADAEHAMIALQTFPIDVLITDVNLPGLSGPEFAATAREIRPAIGIVFATGDIGVIEPQDGAIRLGKPYEIGALIAAAGAALVRDPAPSLKR